MYCKECGTLLPDDSVYCKACGKPTGTVSVEPIRRTAEKKHNACSIVGFSLAMASWFFFILWEMSETVASFGVFWFMSCGAGLVLSIVGWVQATRNKNKKGLAIAGFICTAFWAAFIGLIVSILLISLSLM